jgi:hypothetical protein
MQRSELERKVADLLGRPSSYSTYGNNFRGGTVLYRNKGCNLRVTYKAGAPAPHIMITGKELQHLSPKDEEVQRYEALSK